MGRKRSPGLYKRGSVYYIDKVVRKTRIHESCWTGDLAEAELVLARRIEEIRKAQTFGVRPKRTFRAAATKYLDENQHKRSISSVAKQLQILDRYIGALPLESLHMGTLQPFITARRKQGVKARTINAALEVVRRIANLAATEWVDGNNLTWLRAAPTIRMEPMVDARAPYPLTWEEQEKLFKELPLHLANMAIFAVNTGLRDREICTLRWDWEVCIPQLGASVFVLPQAKTVKDRMVVLNDAARSVIEAVRGEHSEFVFIYKDGPIQTMNNSAWQKARKRAGLPVRVHDLKHTFGRRLRSAGVSFEDRQDLLGHTSGRITTHYSRAEISNLLEAANKVSPHNLPTLTLVRSGTR